MGVYTYFGDKYKYLRRYNQILRVFFKYGFEDLVSYMDEKKRFRFLRKLVPDSLLNEAKHLSKWEKMRLVAEELGPSFVKFGQLLSSRADLLPEGLIRELEKLQDGVPPVEGKVAIEAVEKEFGKPVLEIFSEFETEAFASASMAQVHRATLKTGEKVVVKIQRPGIKEIIESDIKVMKYVAEILKKRMPSLKSLDPVALVKSFEESILRELDFIHESVNIQRFHGNFTADEGEKSHIHSPIVYSSLTTSTVLTLEYIKGIKITDLVKIEQAGLDRKEIAKRLANSFFKQIFDYGFFHADPHPGNLFVLPDNVICFLDYGMMGNIMRKDIEQIAYLFLAVKNKETRKIIRAFQQLADLPVIKNFRELEADLNEFVQNHEFITNGKNEMSSVLLQLKEIMIKHKLKAPMHFYLLGRALVTAEGVIYTLDPDLELTKLARPFMRKTISRHYNPLQFAKRIFTSIYEMGMYMEEFPRDLKSAIRKINTGEIKVDLHHKGIDPLIHTINRTGKQIISALVLAALIVSSTLMIVFKVHPWWGSTSALGICGLIISGLIGFGMIRDLRKGDHDDWPGWEEEG
ncbi:MAG: hypothetical protein IAF38_17910 [Bacteroidia bacterium]|nr:hypothetical protein [Bacteroidia bacterium]